MADDFRSLDVKRVFDPRLSGGSGRDQRRRRQKDGGERQAGRRTAADFFHTIAKAAERSNELLQQRGARFRFCVYRRGAEVMIDVVRLDASGGVMQTTTKKITNQDFDRWIEDVAQMEGLILDTQG